jgi:glucokinase
MPGRLKGLEEFDWSTFLNHPVQVLNDAHAALVAESSWGAAKDIPNVVMLTLGTGIGGGLLINGQLYQGFLQRAGHLGHICVEAANEGQDITGISGSLEDAVGEATLSKRSLGRFSNTTELIAAHISGDTWATYVWLTTVRKLALGIVSFCNAISPDLVVLAGGITQAQEQLLEPLFTFLELYEWRVDGHSTPVKLAHFKEFAGATGAALFARTNN